MFVRYLVTKSPTEIITKIIRPKKMMFAAAAKSKILARPMTNTATVSSMSGTITIHKM